MLNVPSRALVLVLALVASLANSAPTGLPDELEVIKKNAEKMVTDSYNKLGKPANRDFHSRGVCFKGTFKTFPQNLPAGINVAFFATQAIYAMYGRLSNGFPGRDSNDHIPSVFGFGLKILGVPGPKYDIQKLGSTKPRNNNQDWNMATGPTFPFPTAEAYRDHRVMSKLEFARKHFDIDVAVAKGLIHLDSFWHMSYYTQAALHFGEDHVAKFFVTPCDGIEKTIGLASALRRSKTYTTDDLTTHLKINNMCFNFNAQIRPSDETLPEDKLDWAQKYPKDNPTKLWPMDVIRPVKLAEINVPPQPEIEKLQDKCEEQISINPGNTLEDLRPIETDTLMRSRFLAAYEGSVSKRTELNKKDQWEPTAPKREDLEKWLTSVE